MIRAGALFLLVAFILSGLIPFPIESPAPQTSPPATPATPAAPVNLESPDAVPLSLSVRNDGATADRLLGGSTPIALLVAIHRTRLNNGQREMQPVAEGIAVPAGSTVILESGGDHLMLAGLQDNLVQGSTFPITLRFARAGEVTLTVRVRRRVDAAGVSPIPSVTVGELTIWLASAAPASAGSPAGPISRTAAIAPRRPPMALRRRLRARTLLP